MSDTRARFVIYQDAAGEYRWRLVSGNGKIMADSAEGYESKSNVKRAVEQFITLAKDAQVGEA